MHYYYHFIRTDENKKDLYVIIYDSIEVEHSAGFEPQAYPE